jgi:hypothetical protein
VGSLDLVDKDTLAPLLRIMMEARCSHCLVLDLLFFGLHYPARAKLPASPSNGPVERAGSEAQSLSRGDEASKSLVDLSLLRSSLVIEEYPSLTGVLRSSVA